jgi:hypothetical protein
LHRVRAGEARVDHAFSPASPSGRREKTQPRANARDTIATWTREYACVQMAQIKVHGEIDCGAHRLPAGETAARRKKRGRLAGQAAKLIEDRLLLLSKALAPFVTTGEF